MRRGFRVSGYRNAQNAKYVATAAPPSIGCVETVNQSAATASGQRSRSTHQTSAKNPAVAQRNEYWPLASESMKNGLAMKRSESHGSRISRRTATAPAAASVPPSTRNSVTDQSPRSG